MLTPQFLLPVHHEIIVDLFAGGGGASTGIEQATGRPVDVAVNHDREAVSLHEANHPQTRHYCSDVFEVDPATVTEGRPVGLLWASPDCKHFSKAKGGKPVSKKIRSLAWVVIKWAKAVRPRVICLENVEEFQTWGPLAADGRPCPERKGKTFALWVAQLRRLGYVVEWRELRACDYGAPTIRKRLFLVARCDGQPIVWPSPTHAQPDARGKVPAGMKPWRTAADCIDWTVPAPSIFERSKPLADATCRRIAKGIVRYVYEAAQPFIVQGDRYGLQHQQRPIANTHGKGQAHRHQTGRRARPDDGMDDGVRTLHERDQRWHSPQFGAVAAIGQADATLEGMLTSNNTPGKTSRNSSVPCASVRVASADGPGILIPTLIQTGYGERPGQSPRVPGLDKPLGTVVSGQKHALVSAFLAKHYTGVVGSDMAEPMGTVTTVDHHSLVAAHLVHMGHGEGKCGTRRFSHGVRSVAEPLNTVTASGAAAGLVQAFLVKYYGTDQDPALREPLHTVTTKGRFGLVLVRGEAYHIADIGLRMLAPRELYRAQGFPESYRIDTGAAGEPITKTAQVRMCGNSVCPPLARALVAANYADLRVPERAAA